MASIQKYNFPAAKRGDTYIDVEFTLSLNSVPQDLTGASIRMWVVEPNSTTHAADFNTTNGKITITDAVNGVFRTSMGIIKLLPKVYNYDIEITFITGIVKTWIEGTFTVVNDFTK